MSEEKFETSESLSKQMEIVATIFRDPESFNLQHNLHNWPSHSALDLLPSTFWTEFSDGGNFAIVRNEEQYLQLPTTQLLELLDISNLAELETQRIGSIDLPNFGIQNANIEDLADLLLDLRD